jgi:hypothetical protein
MMNYPIVMAGLVPAVHQLKKLLRRMMDARVKPGHDEGESRAVDPRDSDAAA